MPVHPKEQAMAALHVALEELDNYCRRRGIDIAAIIGSAGLERLALLANAFDALVTNDQTKNADLALLSRELQDEAERAAREGLSEAELAVFDVLGGNDLPLSAADATGLKQTARELLVRLQAESLALDWRKRQQTRAQTLTVIRDVLDRALPPAYTPERYEQVCAAVYEHVYDAYPGPDRSVYTDVA